MNRILVTGATGYLGTVMVKTLHGKGYDVTSLALPGDETKYVKPYSSIRYGDVTDMVSLEKAAADIDVIIHLAGIVDITARNRPLMRRINIGGTRNVAQLCRKRGIKMIHCSSVHAFPCPPENETISEATEIDFRKVEGTYGKTKAEATQMMMKMIDDGLDAMIFFPAGVIGPFERRMSNIGNLIVDFVCGGLKAYVDGAYNFVDVRDIALGVCGMLEHWQRGEKYIFSGHVVSVKDMIAEIAEASGKKMLRVKMPYWFAYGTSYFAEAYYAMMHKKPLFTHYSMITVRSNCRFNNKKAQEQIGFQPRPLHESLADMTRWMMEHYTVRAGKRYKACAYREAAAGA